MELFVLNTAFESVAIIDSFESLIWTDRYWECGDFELYAHATPELLSVMQPGYYLYLKSSEHVMIIENRQMSSDIDDGDYITVTGRSLESLLDRRIIWGQTVLTGSFQAGIQQLLNENVISPSDPNRRMSNFIFEVSTDPLITAQTIDAQFLRDNLYTAITELCLEKNIGFKVTLSQANKFVFKLYAGVDRSYNQDAVPYVVFSPNFDNLISTEYGETSSEIKNVALVVGEGNDDELTRKATVVGSGSDLNRREMYVDASDISQTVDEVEMSDEEYAQQLNQRGLLALSETYARQSFESEVDSVRTFTYGKDFSMGDIVQFDSGYGPGAVSRVIELIQSHNLEGINSIPTFMIVEDTDFATSGTIIRVPGGGTGVGGSSGSGGGSQPSTPPTLAELGGLPISGGTMTGPLYAQTNTNYTVAQVRNIMLRTSVPSNSEGNNGDVCIVYT